jgi:hypothetical protein
VSSSPPMRPYTATLKRVPGLLSIGNSLPPSAEDRGRAPLRSLLSVLCSLASAACLCACCGSAQAAPSLAWSSPAPLPGVASATGVSCSSESLCVAVDSEGTVLVTGDPTAATPKWNSSPIDLGVALSGVSCSAAGTCVAVDAHGDTFATDAPASGAWREVPIAGAGPLTAVSCTSASTTLCVAVDKTGGLWTSTTPLSGGWHDASFGSEHEWKSVSCASPTLCAAVDAARGIFTSTSPTGERGAWNEQQLDVAEPLGASCASVSLCVVVDAHGRALASSNPGVHQPSWVLSEIDLTQRLEAVSCASSGLCVALDEAGRALASDDAGAAIPEWSAAGGIDPGRLAGVSCLASGFCLAVDASGHSLSARVAAPAATTLAPTETTSSSAELAGLAEPRDAVLDSCVFEYGTQVPYTGSVPCSLAPGTIAAAGRTAVQASLGGLAANTTYHYRLVLASASGTGVGADQTFTTAASSQIALVTPNPSVSGTPAVGQHLSCHPNLPAGALAQLTYAWIRDQIPIPATNSSSYTVKGQDSGHHLQCQVTATDGGGSVAKKSTFVTIPVGGAPVSAGETTVGGASFHSNRVLVPVDCSAQSSGGCELTLRLSAVETLSGRRVLAVAAHASARARSAPAGRAAAVRHATVTLASARVHLDAGESTTVAATLGAAAKRLLRARGHFTASLSVSGTVIGVIEARLAEQQLALSASGGHAARRGARVGAAQRAVVVEHSAYAAAPAPAAARAAQGRPAARADAQGRPAARAAARGLLAATPYMGWDTYFALGGNYSEATILEQASQLISLGLERRGYRYVWLDVGWWHGTRGPDGEITVSAKQWPHGLAWLTRTLHSAGFLVGLYTDAGPSGCGGAGQGSYGHYQQDVNTFAAWGFDAVKVDFCGGAELHLNPAVAYGELHQAIEHNASHRPMLQSICDFLQPEQYGEERPLEGESAFSSYTFGPTVGNSWRTDTDVGLPGNVPFGDVLRNMDADAAAPQAAGPGHWNDPDYLAPDQGMSATQFRSQLSMWAMLAAPLMISDNLTKIGRSSLEALLNGEVTAIDQDPAGVQGTLLSASGNGEVWVKPLVGGSRAVALLNRGSSPTLIQTSAAAVGLPHAASYALRNVWTHTTGTSGGSIAAEVPGDTTVLLRVSPR